MLGRRKVSCHIGAVDVDAVGAGIRRVIEPSPTEHKAHKLEALPQSAAAAVVARRAAIDKDDAEATSELKEERIVEVANKSVPLGALAVRAPDAGKVE